MNNTIQENVCSVPCMRSVAVRKMTVSSKNNKNESASKEGFNQISFGSSVNSCNFTKRFRLMIRRLFHYMSSPSEVTNSIIAAIGTGIIAPAVILVSPGKGDKEDKDKKKFQALRQPLSAILALSFQLPMTRIVSSVTNKLAYQDHVKFFSDDKLGDLIPDKKYLKKHISKDEYTELEREFDTPGKNNEKSALRKELENLITDGHKEVGLETTEEELAKRVKKRKKDFLKGKYAEAKRDEIVKQKVKELLNKDMQIDELDLVSESDQKLAIHRNKDAYAKIRQEANLSAFDKIVDSLGMSNKKLSNLKNRQKSFAKEKALEILKTDHKEVFETQEAKLTKYVKVLEENSKELFNHRKFLITLIFNLCMTVLSCMALNWVHPRFKEWLDNRHLRTENNKQNAAPVAGQKVEVRA